MRRFDLPSWAAPTAAGFGVAAVLATGGWAAADAASHPDPASAGRVIEVRRQVVRAAPYAPPPVTEEARLDVRPTAYAAAPLAPEAQAAWSTLEAEDRARMAQAAQAVRAEDARLDRELRAQLAAVRAEAAPAAVEASEAPPVSAPANEG